MNNQQPLQPNPTIFGVGTIIGLALGLFIGWVLWPVQWEGLTLRDLDVGTKAEYIAAVADAFVIYESPEAAANAQRRLAPIEVNLAGELTSAITYFQNSDQPEQNIRVSNIRQLANSLGILLPDPQLALGQQQGQAATPPIATSIPVGNAGLQSQSDLPSPADLATGVGSSWLRSLLWFLAILLIFGGVIFLLGASGLVDWQSLALRWFTPTAGGRPEDDLDVVDKFDVDKFDIDEFDVDDYAFDQADEFDDYGAEDLDTNRRQRPNREQTDLNRERSNQERTTSVDAFDDYSFDSEEHPDVHEHKTELGNWRYSHEAESEENPFNEFESDEEIDELAEEGDDWQERQSFSDQHSSLTTVNQRSAQEPDDPELFSPTDFDEADLETVGSDYRTAYVGQRYTDDGAVPAHMDGEVDSEVDDGFEGDSHNSIIDDNRVDANWAVPTVDSVLASSAGQPPFRTDNRKAITDDDVSDDLAEEGLAGKNSANDDIGIDEGSDGAFTSIQADAPSVEQASPSPFARLTNRNRQHDSQRADQRDNVAVPKQTDKALPSRRGVQTTKRPPQSPGHTPRARHKVIDQHTLHYQLGIQEYDESKPIVDPTSNKYIGEFGMGTSIKNALVHANPEQVVALEVWLFDKSDEQSIGNKTRILLSEYAIDNNLDRIFLKERQDDPRPFTAQRGVHFQLESKNLLLDCMIVDVQYIASGTSKGMFQNIKVDMSVHLKG